MTLCKSTREVATGIISQYFPRIWHTPSTATSRTVVVGSFNNSCKSWNCFWRVSSDSREGASVSTSGNASTKSHAALPRTTRNVRDEEEKWIEKRKRKERREEKIKRK